MSSQGQGSCISCLLARSNLSGKLKCRRCANRNGYFSAWEFGCAKQIGSRRRIQSPYILIVKIRRRANEMEPFRPAPQSYNGGGGAG